MPALWWMELCLCHSDGHGHIKCVFWNVMRSVWLFAACFLMGGVVFLSCCLLCDFPALEPADCWGGWFLVLKREPLYSIFLAVSATSDLVHTLGYSWPALPLETPQDSREVWPRFLWRYCFVLGPSACETLCVSSKNGVSEIVHKTISPVLWISCTKRCWP